MNISSLLSSNYAVYFTLDDERMFQFNLVDGTRTEVSAIPVLDRSIPIMVLHKNQFDFMKKNYLNLDSPNRISLSSAELYNQIGFITDEELKAFSNHLKSSDTVTEQECNHKEKQPL